MNVAVDPEHRREGVATALIKHLLAEIEGTDKVMLEVRGSNERGDRDVPRASASTPVGHRRRYYQDNGEDALVMELELGLAPDDPRGRDELR